MADTLYVHITREFMRDNGCLLVRRGFFVSIYVKVLISILWCKYGCIFWSPSFESPRFIDLVFK